MYDPVKTIVYDTSVEDSNACSVDVYHPSTATSQPQHLVVFIHGGAWRTGDKLDHADIPSLLAEAMKTHDPSTIANDAAPIIMVPNYRLSYHPDHPERDTTLHPTHILDIARFFNWLITQWAEEESGSSWNSIRNVYLVGHSCGAHILSHIFFSLPTPLPTTSIPSKTLTTLQDNLLALLRKTRGAAFLDGIYDLPALVAEYPTYSFFVDAAFGPDQSLWADAGVLFTSAGGKRVPPRAVMDGLEGTRVVVAHATEDELLSPMQGKMWVDYLIDVGLGEQTAWDESTLRGTHDGCLHHAGLGELLYKLVVDA